MGKTLILEVGLIREFYGGYRKQSGLDIFINARRFPMGVGRNLRTPGTLLAYYFRSPRPRLHIK